MIRTRCPIHRDHYIYRQASPEWDAPRRETARDFVLAFGTWALIVLAYIMGGYAVWAMVQ